MEAALGKLRWRLFNVYLTVSCWIALGGIGLSLLSACAKPQPSASTALPEADTPSPAVVTARPSNSGGISTPVLPTKVSTSTPVTVDLRSPVIRFWYVRQVEAEGVAPELVEEFNKTNQWGIRVELVRWDSSGVMDEALYSALQEKKLPELLAGYSYDLQHWNAEGVSLANLQPYIEDPAWGLTSYEQQDFYLAIWAQDLSIQSKKEASLVRFAMPWYRTGLVLLYNQSWAEDLGFDLPPASAAQFRQQACAAAKANREDDERQNDGTGGWLVDTSPSTLLSWIFAFGGQVEQVGQPGYQFDNPGAEDAFTFLHALYAEGCAWQREELDRKNAFVSRQALFLSASLQELVDFQSAFKEAGSNDEWTILPFPSRKGGAFAVFGPSLAVTKSSSEKQLAAWLFVRWLASPEIQARWVLATGTLPTRISVLSLLKDKPEGSRQWEKALGLLPYAQVEPSFASWRTLRWALTDAMTQLLTPGFSGSQIPALLKELDQLAEEVQDRAK